MKTIGIKTYLFENFSQKTEGSQKILGDLFSVKIRSKWAIIPFFRSLKILGEAGKQDIYNKCSQNSRSQIVFRTDIFQELSLGAPANSYLGLERRDSIFLRNFWLQAMTKNLNIDEVKIILSKRT